jgi:two-component sensor histidine kinase
MGRSLGLRNIEQYLLAARPWSVRALLVALLAFAAGVLLRLAFAPFGVTLYFAAFFPSVLAASVVAGPPAGVFTVVLSALFVWWGLLDPVFVFGPLRPVDYANFALFFFAAGLIIVLAHVYRAALVDLAKAEMSQSLLIAELNHRAGNTLAVIQSIVNGTVTKDKDALQQLTSRIGALARANKLAQDQGGASITSLILTEVEPYAPSSRIDLQGPSVLLSGDVARNVGLVIHELTTNAAKYGALSNQSGRIRVRWSEKDGSCCLSWTELEGPAVQAPTRIGFGSRMMSACLKNIDGTIEPEFSPEGYRCKLVFSTASKEGFVLKLGASTVIAPSEAAP